MELLLNGKKKIINYKQHYHHNVMHNNSQSLSSSPNSHNTTELVYNSPLSAEQIAYYSHKFSAKFWRHFPWCSSFNLNKFYRSINNSKSNQLVSAKYMDSTVFAFEIIFWSYWFLKLWSLFPCKITIDLIMKYVNH